MTEKLTQHERLLADWLDAANREHWHLTEYHLAKVDSDAAWARLKAHLTETPDAEPAS